MKFTYEIDVKEYSPYFIHTEEAPEREYAYPVILGEESKRGWWYRLTDFIKNDTPFWSK